MPVVPKLPGRSPERPGSSAPGQPRRYKQAPKGPNRFLRAAVAVLGTLVLVGAVITAYAVEPADDDVSASSAATATTEATPASPVEPESAPEPGLAPEVQFAPPEPEQEPQLQYDHPGPAAEPEPDETPTPDAASEGSAVQALGDREPTRIVRPEAQAAPVTIDVPAAGVSAPVDPLGIARDRTLEVPEDYSRVGWWSGGPTPGELGPAVLVGHLDSVTAPAVFYDLDKLNPGDEIHVTRSDDSVATFMVERIESFPKTMFPTAEVYGAADDSSLRLVTCYGSFEEAQRSYQDNLIVYANLVS
ncbi:hypothetical protein BH23ACT2_BH23ACT2_09930 [soil metagenome]